MSVNILSAPLCIHASEGMFLQLFDANAQLPARKTVYITTSEENQTAIAVHLVQKFERRIRPIAWLTLANISIASRGKLKVALQVTIGRQGELSFSANECGDGAENAPGRELDIEVRQTQSIELA